MKGDHVPRDATAVDEVVHAVVDAAVATFLRIPGNAFDEAVGSRAREISAKALSADRSQIEVVLDEDQQKINLKIYLDAL